MNVFKLSVFLAWAGAAMSSAAPVDAEVLTSQIGTHATCAASLTGKPYTDACWGQEWPYRQVIKFQGVPCNGGPCNYDGNNTYNDFIYSTGRKEAFLNGTCGNLRLYELGICAC